MRLCIENSLKINKFLYKTYFLYKTLCLYRYTLAIGYLATGEISENMLQLKRFGLYFEGIMNRKWLLSYRNKNISYRDARGFGSIPANNKVPILCRCMPVGADCDE